MLNGLIIDDRKSFLDTLEDILTNRYHLHITTATSVEEGLGRLNESYNLICVDFNMPSKNGYDFCKEVKTNPEFEFFSNIPIIGIGNFPLNKREYLYRGICLEKPFSIDNLCAVMSKIVFGDLE